MIDLDSLVHDSNGLEPLPASVMRLLDLLSSDDWCLDAVVETASLDVALTARILKVANSAANSAAAPVTTLKEATMRLGATMVVKIATGSAIRRYMAAPKDASVDTGEQELWRQSVATALAADVVSARSPIDVPQEAFTVALLNDIGRIVLSRYLDPKTRSLLDRAVSEGKRNPLEAEREILGVDHAELGALIAEHWKLPALIANSIRFHHTPTHAQEPEVQILCDVISVADAAACVVADRETPRRSFDCADSTARLGLDDCAFDELCETVGERLESAMADYD